MFDHDLRPIDVFYLEVIEEKWPIHTGVMLLRLCDGGPGVRVFTQLVKLSFIATLGIDAQFTIEKRIQTGPFISSPNGPSFKRRTGNSLPSLFGLRPRDR